MQSVEVQTQVAVTKPRRATYAQVHPSVRVLVVPQDNRSNHRAMGVVLTRHHPQELTLEMVFVVLV